jgi:hypothetical protein
MKVQHQQVQQDRRQTLTEFIKEGEVNLKHWMIVICFRKVKNSRILEPWSLKNSSSCLLSFKIDVN